MLRLSRRNSGFNIHNQVEITSQDKRGRESLTQYILRSPYLPGKNDLPEGKPEGEMRIISFIDQPEVIKKILEHLGLWEESHAPPDRSQGQKEITFDPSFTQLD